MVSDRKCIFVSYSHGNADWAERLRFHQDPGGIDNATFWIDRNRLKPGDLWTREARGAIKLASAV